MLTVSGGAGARVGQDARWGSVGNLPGSTDSESRVCEWDVGSRKALFPAGEDSWASLCFGASPPVLREIWMARASQAEQS